jgi:methionyl-tRNA formyltransferase
MRVFIDGLSSLAHTITRKLVDAHDINPCDILVNTYDRTDTIDYRSWLDSQSIRWVIASYRDQSTINQIAQFDPDLILSAYGLRIIPVSVLDLSHMAINMHPSYLPDYKGRWVCPWAIINGEVEHGITFHSMTAKIDVGDILFQKKVPIAVDETAWSLYNKLIAEFVREFDNFFKALKEQRLDSKPMPNGGRFFRQGLPFDGMIDTSWNADQIERFIRAMFFPPHLGATIKIHGTPYECDSYEKYLVLTSQDKKSSYQRLPESIDDNLTSSK